MGSMTSRREGWVQDAFEITVDLIRILVELPLRLVGVMRLHNTYGPEDHVHLVIGSLIRRWVSLNSPLISRPLCRGDLDLPKVGRLDGLGVACHFLLLFLLDIAQQILRLLQEQLLNLLFLLLLQIRFQLQLLRTKDITDFISGKTVRYHAVVHISSVVHGC